LKALLDYLKKVFRCGNRLIPVNETAGEMERKMQAPPWRHLAWA